MGWVGQRNIGPVPTVHQQNQRSQPNPDKADPPVKSGGLRQGDNRWLQCVRKQRGAARSTTREIKQAVARNKRGPHVTNVTPIKAAAETAVQYRQKSTPQRRHTKT